MHYLSLYTQHITSHFIFNTSVTEWSCTGEVDKELEVMLLRMSAQEQKCLIRIVLKDMRLGMGTNRVLNAFHPDARELYDFTNSLQQVCLFIICVTLTTGTKNL